MASCCSGLPAPESRTWCSACSTTASRWSPTTGSTSRTASPARPPAALAGLLEVRGLGVVRVAHDPAARIALAVALGPAQRLPAPETYALLGVPLVRVEPASCSAPHRVALALDCALGRATQLAGAFA